MKGRIRYAQNGDVSIAYETFGRGERDLLFVGGFVGHIDLMRELPLANRFWERLGSFARITSFDKRGMGLSDRDPAEYTVEGVAEDMLAVLDSAGLDRVTLFGVSEGGSAATYFSATHPDRVEAMVQYGTYARMCRGPDNPEGIPVENLRRMLRRLVDEWGGSAHLEWWAPSLAGDESALEWWGRLLRAGTSRSAVDRLQEMYERLDVRELLPLVPVPSLVLWRRDDKMVPAGLSRAVAEGIPDARGIEMPGDDHLFIAGDQAALLGEIEEFMTGSRAPQRAERTLATVLFTDIVGSTELAARLGDARWRELLGEHDRLARAAVEAERGWLVKSTGDGVFATFEGPGRAIAAAQRLRAAAAAAGLEIRAGIHTGECERLDGDVGGIAVHIGARVSSAACGGEVLVSQTVRDLVVGSDLSFEDRGAHALKGIPGEWRLYAVTD